MVTKINPTMPRGCATTVITSMAGPKNHGTAHIPSYTLQECAKIAILSMFGKSHVNVFNILGQALIERGHDVSIAESVYDIKL